MTDNELIGAYLVERSYAAFSEIVTRYQRMVYGTCRRILSDSHAAEDATQVTFLLFARKAAGLRSRETLAGWFYWAAERTARQALRTRKRLERREKEAGMSRQSELDRTWEAARPVVDMAIAALPAGQREVLVLRYLQQKSEQETAMALGLNRSAVSMRLGRALEGVRTFLKRRGIIMTGVALGTCLTGDAALAAPAGLTSSIVAAASGTSAVSPMVALLLEETMKASFMAQVKAVALYALMVMAIGATGAMGVYAASAPEAGYAETSGTVAGNAHKVSGKTYYVSPDGAGSSEDAKQPGSINDTLKVLKGGDAMLLLGGEYAAQKDEKGLFLPLIDLNKYFRFAEAPTEEKPLVIAAAPGEKPVLKGDITSGEGGPNRGVGVLLDSQQCSYVTIEGLTICGFWSAGIRIGYDDPPHDITIRGCEFYDIRCNDNMGGVYIHSASRVIVENCLFHKCVYKRPDYENKGSGMIIFQAIDLTIRNNEFRDLVKGLYYKHGERKTGRGGFTKITGNWFHRITEIGAASNQNRTEFANNVFDGCRLTMHNEDGTLADFTFGIVIRNNTFLNDAALSFPWQGGGGKFSGPRDVTVRDNIFYNSNYAIWAYGSDEVYQKGIGLVSDSNCFYRAKGKQTVGYFESENWGASGGRYNLADWKKLGFDIQSIEADPQFVDPTKGDCHLKKGSPCPAMGAFPLESPAQ